MKTKHFIRLFTGAICLTVLFACSKNNGKTSNSSSTATDLQTQADDQAQVSNESDAIVNDANVAMNSSVSIAGNSITAGTGGTVTNGINTPLGNLICDATVTINDTADPRSITITYNGTNCWGNRTRTGVVVISIPSGVHWKDAGAVVTLSIQDLKITRIRDNKSITINGTKTFTNKSGGLLIDLASSGPITHTIEGSMSVTFNNGSKRDWNIARQRVYSYDNGLVITTTGLHSDSSNNSGIAEWGTNRFGTGFESLITAPKVIRQDCDFRLVSGENEILRTDNVTTTITYGLDANGNATTCPGTGTYYFKVVRTNAGGLSFTRIMPY